MGAPVAQRAWAIPHWLECIAAQTMQPDAFVFVVSPSTDGTDDALQEAAGIGRVHVVHSDVSYRPRQHRLGSGWVAEFVHWRNLLLERVRELQPTVFVSLDTDVMLEDRRTLERRPVSRRGGQQPVVVAAPVGRAVRVLQRWCVDHLGPGGDTSMAAPHCGGDR